jgi:hypothetical protein
MKICFSCLTLVLIFVAGAVAQPAVNPLDVWKGVIELPKDQLTRYVLNDLPGTICMLVPSPEGTRAMLLGNKVLKKDSKPPELQALPQVLVSSTITKERLADVSFLSFLSASLETKDQVKFSATETAHASVLDAQVDWPELEKRIAEMRKDYPNLPPGTQFGVVRVATVLAISYQTFKGVKNAARIAGWGFAGSGTYLTQKSDELHLYKVGVSLTYSSPDLGGAFKGLWNPRGANDTPNDVAYRNQLDKTLTMKFLTEMKGPAQFADEETLQEFK